MKYSITSIRTRREGYVVCAASTQLNSILPVNRRSQLPLRPLNILHQIFNRTHLNTPLLPKPQTSIPPHHPIAPPHLSNPLGHLPILNQLRNNTHGTLTCQPAQVNSSLGVSCPLAHAAGTRAQRDDVARAPEVFEAGSWGGEGATGERAVLCRDAGCYGRIVGVDGDGVRGAFGVGVVGDHLGEREAVGDFGGYGGAD